MCRTPFYRTSNELKYHFSNIERTRTCSSIGYRTRTPYFWLRTIEHRTSNLIGPSLDLLNCWSNRLEHHFFEHRTNSNMFIDGWLNSNSQLLASHEQTSNIERNRAFTRFTKLLIIFSNIEWTRTCSSFGNRTWTPYFWLPTIDHQTF